MSSEPGYDAYSTSTCATALASPRSVQHAHHPAWLSELSPWNCEWSEIIEHRDWYGRLSGPPFSEASLLRRNLLRRSPAHVPRVLCDGARASDGAALLSTELAQAVDEGAAGVVDSLERHTPAEVMSLLDLLEHEPAVSLTSNVSLSTLAGRVRVLLSPAADAYRDRMLQLAAAMTRHRHGPRVALYAPLYLSNECTNRCSYCGFSYGNEVVRKTLSKDEIAQELAQLLDMQMSEVLLLSGEAPRQVGVEYLEQAVRQARATFSRVGLEVYPMCEEEYERLVIAGASALTIYQESYDPDIYHQVHHAGRKRDYLWRLGAPERAAAAGIGSIGLGSLLGLSPWRFEALALGLHVAVLLEQFPHLALTLSFPRLRPAQGLSEVPHPVDDAALLHYMSALRLCLPAQGFVLSTRESSSLRDYLAPLLITKMSAGSCTDPGGYSERAKIARAGNAPLGVVARPEQGGQERAKKSAAQFEISDERTPDVVRDALLRAHLTPCG